MIDGSKEEQLQAEHIKCSVSHMQYYIMIGCPFLMPGGRDGHLYPVSNAFFTAVKANTKAIIGGHISSMETTQEALKREFEEELHAQIEIDHLIAVGEIFFPCATLDYDFSEEKKFSYKNLSMDEIIHHLAVFVSRLWQIHVFGDADVIIGTRLEKPSKINGFALLSPIFLSHAGWREDGAVHINTYYTKSQMGLCG